MVTEQENLEMVQSWSEYTLNWMEHTLIPERLEVYSHPYAGENEHGSKAHNEAFEFYSMTLRNIRKVREERNGGREI